MIGVKRRNGRVIHGEGLQRAWTPGRIPGLVDWFDAGVGISLNSGNVSQWAPRNGSDSTHILSQATASLQPPYIASDSNFAGKPSIFFTSLKYLRSATWTSSVQQPITYYVVAKMSILGAYAILVDGLTQPTRNTLYNAYSCTKLYSGTEIGSTPTVSSPCIYVAEFSGSTSKLFRNDFATDILGGGNIGTHPLIGLHLGCNGGTMADAPAESYLAELFVCYGSHSQSMRTRLGRYFGAKYGIATS